MIKNNAGQAAKKGTMALLTFTEKCRSRLNPVIHGQRLLLLTQALKRLRTLQNNYAATTLTDSTGWIIHHPASSASFSLGRLGSSKICLYVALMSSLPFQKVWFSASWFIASSISSHTSKMALKKG